MTGRGPSSSSSTLPRASSSERSDGRDAVTEILVLVDHENATVRRTTAAMLTLARRLGEPSAVFVGSGVEAARETLKRYGAEKVYVLDAPELTEYLGAPRAEALASLVDRLGPAAVLVASSADGKEIAARLAIKTGS